MFPFMFQNRSEAPFRERCTYQKRTVRAGRAYRYSLLCLLFCALLAACSSSPSGHSSSQKPSLPQNTATSTQQPAQPVSAGWQGQAGTLSPTIDLISQQVLQNISQHGWNPDATIHGKVTGGLFINWQMNDPSQTNNLKQGMDDVTSGSHDPQVDLFYLNALSEYHVLHPQDHQFDQQLAKITNLIQSEFKNYNLPKGWIYFYLLRDGLLLENLTLVQIAHTVAQNYYTHWYDPSVSMLYNRAHSPGVYAPEQSITAGAALIDAGTRWNQPSWVMAGKSTIDKAVQFSYDTKADLFYNNMTIEPNGSQVVSNTQAKPATQGSIVEALVKAYEVTHDQHYLTIAGQTLQGLFASGLWDTTNGGFYFAKDLDTGKIHSDYKETRSQLHVLIGLEQYNNALHTAGQSLQFLDKQDQLVSIMENRCYQSTYHGYFYRMTPDFQIYTSRPGTGIGYEDFFTTEAMGSALDALQQTEFAHLSF